MKSNDSLTCARGAAADEWYTTPAMLDAGATPCMPAMRGRDILCPCDDLTHTAFPDWVLAHWDECAPKSLTVVAHVWDGGLLGGHGAMRTWTASDRYSDRVLVDDGDFRSPEVTAMLAPGTLVFTNPPFSLTREFIPWVLEHDADMLIVNNLNNLTTGRTGGYLLAGRIRLAHGDIAGMGFATPDGRRRLGFARWFTTLPETPADPPRPLHPTRRYRGHEGEWRSCDTYPAIDCPTLADIPVDYRGVMGVPITFADHMDARHWRLIGILDNDASRSGRPVVDGRRTYKRLLIRRA